MIQKTKTAIVCDDGARAMTNQKALTLSIHIAFIGIILPLIAITGLIAYIFSK